MKLQRCGCSSLDIEARDTGVNRGTLTRLYYETAERIELEVLDQLCAYFSIELTELIE
ncbi:MAG: XRE family transcriptional regulator [Polaromonas sp.]|nr:MAG: XRE family transcriptional regulator [Polaromonas sp.]